MSGIGERRTLLVHALLDSKLDAIVCSSSTEILLLTGYWPVMSSSVAIHAADGDVRLIVPEDEVELAQKTSAIKLIAYKPADLKKLEPPIEQLRAPLAQALRELSLEDGAIGLQLGEGVEPASYAVGYRFRSALLTLLEQLVPHATFKPCDELLNSLKAVKTRGELALLGSACEVAATAFAHAEEAIDAGIRETEVAARIRSTFETAPAALQFERSYGYFFCMSGPNSAKASAAYARTRQRELESGDLVMIHANTCADGYWTDITRTFTVGPPSPRQTEMRNAIMEARAAGLAAIRPGVTGAEVDRAVRSVMEEHGMGEAFRHAAGHGVGFAAANPNGLPRIHPLSQDVLEAGMTFNVEPAAYFDGYGGMRHCDLVAVTHNGVEVMTRF